MVYVLEEGKMGKLRMWICKTVDEFYQLSPIRMTREDVEMDVDEALIFEWQELMERFNAFQERLRDFYERRKDGS